MVTVRKKVFILGFLPIIFIALCANIHCQIATHNHAKPIAKPAQTESDTIINI
jgi:hypothetical protein